MQLETLKIPHHWNDAFMTIFCTTCSVYVNPFEPPKPKLCGSVMGSPCSRRMRYAASAARRNNLSSDTEEAWADALDREEEDSVFRQLQQETAGGCEDLAAVAVGDCRPRVSERTIA